MYINQRFYVVKRWQRAGEGFKNRRHSLWTAPNIDPLDKMFYYSLLMKRKQCSCVVHFIWTCTNIIKKYQILAILWKKKIRGRKSQKKTFILTNLDGTAKCQKRENALINLTWRAILSYDSGTISNTEYEAKMFMK